MQMGQETNVYMKDCILKGVKGVSGWKGVKEELSQKSYWVLLFWMHGIYAAEG